MNRRPKSNKATGRSYKYDSAYQKKPSQVKNRVARNKARRQALAKLAKKYGKTKAKSILRGKDVDHKRPLSKGGSNRSSNRRIISSSTNRARK